jgi:hypothetical protein
LKSPYFWQNSLESHLARNRFGNDDFSWISFKFISALHLRELKFTIQGVAKVRNHSDFRPVLYILLEIPLFKLQLEEWSSGSKTQVVWHRWITFPTVAWTMGFLPGWFALNSSAFERNVLPGLPYMKTNSTLSFRVNFAAKSQL